MAKQPLVLVNIIGEVIEAMSVTGLPPINYFPGKQFQILKALNDIDNSITYKAEKYPFLAMILPVPLVHGTGYVKVKIPRIVIATLVNGDADEDVLMKFKDDGTFKTILYPWYYEFLNQCCQHPRINEMEIEDIIHTMSDNPGVRPEGAAVNDYVDFINILNLEITLNYNKNC